MLRDIYFWFQRTTKFFREAASFLVALIRDYRSKNGADAGIRIAYNGYSSGRKSDWFQIFIAELTGRKVAVSWYRPSLIMCSSFGSYWLLKILLWGYKTPSLFFSEENLATLKKYREYRTYLNSQTSLAMGFDYCHADNYRRFPLWLLYLFSPEFAINASLDDVQKRLEQIEAQGRVAKTKFAAMIASHGGYALPKKVYNCDQEVSRESITEQVASIDKVHCPGKLLHNDDSLIIDYNDDKKSYLKQFLFNICAENASVSGYVTEKLFEAIEAGTIPIYWGDLEPEPNILNPNRIIFWDKLKSGDVLARIRELHQDEEARKKFLERPLFTRSAAAVIHGYFRQLRKDFRELLATESTTTIMQEH